MIARWPANQSAASIVTPAASMTHTNSCPSGWRADTARAQLAGPLSPASARTPVDVGGVGSGATNTCPDRVGRGTAWVTLAGDWITIRDNCSDGIRVKGVVTMTVNGQLKTYTCVNYGGGGTTHECSFDWVEGYVGVKTLAFYSERTAGKGDWVLGQIAHWRDG